MKRKRGWTTCLGTPVVALTLLATATASARAEAKKHVDTAPPSSTLLTYDSIGSSIDSTGISTTGTGITAADAAGAIKFVPVSGGSFMTPSALSLAAFQAKALGEGQSVTYNNTPFHIKFGADSVNGVSTFSPNQTPIDIVGHLNGTLTGAKQSNVLATFDKPPGSTDTDSTSVSDTASAKDSDGYVFRTGLYTNTLQVPESALAIAPSSSGNGLTTVQGILNSNPIGAPVPEPSTLVLFAATAAGLVFRHRIRKGRGTD
ncbi:MAG: hypothetical protein NVSMB9_15040 [Isosphaeraceae bacterium]